MNSTTNSTIAPKEEQPHEVFSVMVTRLVIQSFLAVFGSVGNFLVCISILRIRNLRSSIGNIFLLNLSIADLGILLLCFPFAIVKETSPLAWPFGSFICKTLFPFSDIFYGVSIGTITAIAVYRYKGIVLVMKPQISSQMAYMVILATWVIPFVSICIPLFLVMEFKKKDDHTDCTPHWPDYLTWRLYFVSLSVLWYFLPLVIISRAYFMIRKSIKSSEKLRKTMRLSAGHTEHYRQRARLESNSRALKILTPLVIVFALTMLPWSIFRICLVFVDMKEYVWYVYAICVVPMVFNSAVDPLIYCIVSNDFRRAIKKLFCRDSKATRSKLPFRIRAMSAPGSVFD